MIIRPGLKSVSFEKVLISETVPCFFILNLKPVMSMGVL